MRTPCVTHRRRILCSSGDPGRPAWQALLLLGSCGRFSPRQALMRTRFRAPASPGPLAPNPNPLTVDAGPFGSVAVTGQVSGIGTLQSHATHAGGIGNQDGFVDLSNAQVEIQTTQGPVQFYVQAGGILIAVAGLVLSASDQGNGSVVWPCSDRLREGGDHAGADGHGWPATNSGGSGSRPSPSRISTSNADCFGTKSRPVSRGVQINYAHGPFSAAVSLNDGYYSGKLNWLSGTLGYAIDSVELNQLCRRWQPIAERQVVCGDPRGAEQQQHLQSNLQLTPAVR